MFSDLDTTLRSLQVTYSHGPCHARPKYRHLAGAYQIRRRRRQQRPSVSLVPFRNISTRSFYRSRKPWSSSSMTWPSNSIKQPSKFGHLWLCVLICQMPCGLGLFHSVGRCWGLLNDTNAHLASTFRLFQILILSIGGQVMKLGLLVGRDLRSPGRISPLLWWALSSYRLSHSGLRLRAEYRAASSTQYTSHQLALSRAGRVCVRVNLDWPRCYRVIQLGSRLPDPRLLLATLTFVQFGISVISTRPWLDRGISVHSFVRLGGLRLLVAAQLGGLKNNKNENDCWLSREGKYCACCVCSPHPLLIFPSSLPL
ncbi:hypothetical protein B0T19DRAFT_33661 [Cercophora scortea]|uniref:Uncharacterized protein n=1 Tax=Cercophora scortea TaxID=314031 RepID=A0AAE0J434_9PEZI|nr:hypothetical protein B0T19DRAFT_33661 [Cercophora scortea]